MPCSAYCGCRAVAAVETGFAHHTVAPVPGCVTASTHINKLPVPDHGLTSPPTHIKTNYRPPS